MKTIKIAPDMDEVRVNGKTVSTEFNGMLIEYNMIDELEESCHEYIKKQLQCAIGLVSKTWQLRELMESIRTTDGRQLGTLKVKDGQTGIVVCP